MFRCVSLLGLVLSAGFASADPVARTALRVDALASHEDAELPMYADEGSLANELLALATKKKATGPHPCTCGCEQTGKCLCPNCNVGCGFTKAKPASKAKTCGCSKGDCSCKLVRGKKGTGCKCDDCECNKCDGKPKTKEHATSLKSTDEGPDWTWNPKKKVWFRFVKTKKVAPVQRFVPRFNLSRCGPGGCGS